MNPCRLRHDTVQIKENCIDLRPIHILVRIPAGTGRAFVNASLFRSSTGDHGALALTSREPIFKQ